MKLGKRVRGEKIIAVAMETPFGNCFGVLFRRGVSPLIFRPGESPREVGWEVISIWTPISDNREYVYIAEVMRRFSDADKRRIEVRRKAPTREEMEDAKD